jgi:hypothetical protein
VRLVVAHGQVAHGRPGPSWWKRAIVGSTRPGLRPIAHAHSKVDPLKATIVSNKLAAKSLNSRANGLKTVSLSKSARRELKHSRA